jgi:glycerol-3-phosphate acyltransferase PlsX
MDQVSIAVDAMGGDHAPDIVVDAAVMALEQEPNIILTLFGNEDMIKDKLVGRSYDQSRLNIVNATETIDNNESPVLAIRRKKESSIVKGLRYVKEGHADAFVSAGSTGAVLAGGTLIIGRIKGVERPALGSFIPTKNGVTLLMDCGANVDSKPIFLHQFAKMGASYSQSFTGKARPTIGLLNVGEEEKKGNSLTKETYILLKQDTSLNFIGNIEGRDIASGQADVIIADGFTGNLILKHTEGLAMFLLSQIKQAITSTWYSKIGALLIKGPLKKMLKSFDYTEYGGAPLLGLEGLVVKAHGSSNAKAFKNAIVQCKTFSDEKVNEKIKQQLI